MSTGPEHFRIDFVSGSYGVYCLYLYSVTPKDCWDWEIGPADEKSAVGLRVIAAKDPSPGPFGFTGRSPEYQFMPQQVATRRSIEHRNLRSFRHLDWKLLTPPVSNRLGSRLDEIT